jgi:hypothetical protein
MSLCKHCHDSTKRFVEKHGFRPDIGLDGRPLDPNHPVYGDAVKPARPKTVKPIGPSRRRPRERVANALLLADQRFELATRRVGHLAANPETRRDSSAASVIS